MLGFQPVADCLISRFTGQRIAEYAMIDVFVKSLQNRLGAATVHIGNPHRQDIRAAIFSPLQAV